MPSQAVGSRSSGRRSNVRLANQTRCGSATSMFRTFNVSVGAVESKIKKATALRNTDQITPALLTYSAVALPLD